MLKEIQMEVMHLKVFDIKATLFFIKYKILIISKNDKRCTLNQSTSIDVKINDTENLTLGEILEYSNINLEERIIDNIIIERYKTEIRKTLIDNQEIKIMIMVLFDDLSIEEISKRLKLDITEIRKIY